jgi:hypothetical protein
VAPEVPKSRCMGTRSTYTIQGRRVAQDDLTLCLFYATADDTQLKLEIIAHPG